MDAGVLLLLRGEVEEALVREVAAESGLTVMRRCADVAELCAAAVAGLGSVAVVDADFEVDRTVIEQMHAHGTRVVVRCAEEHVRRYDSLGALGLARGVPVIPAILGLAGAPAGAERVVDALEVETIEAAESTRVAGTGDGTGDGTPSSASRPAHLVAVIGPGGAPGRSTAAINIADDLARRGERTTLIDADLWGGSLAQMVGMLADTAGLSAAVRAADQGTLDPAALDRLAPQVRQNLRLLPGLARASRWREVSAPNVAEVLHAARQEASWVVAEAPVLMPEDEGYAMGPSRNEVAECILAAADEVVVIGAAEPVGMERLVQTLLDLDDLSLSARPHVLVNRVRSSAAGPRAAASVQEALARFADVHDPVLIADDRSMCDRALLQGTTWREVSSRSPALQHLAAFTAELHEQYRITPRRSTRRRGRLGWFRGGRRTPAH